MNFNALFKIAAVALAISAGPVSAEVIKSGATATGVPFNFLDPETNKMTGFLLDVASETAKRGGFEFDLQTVDFPSLVPALQSGRIDIITSSFAISDERKKVVDFAVPLYGFSNGLLLPAGNPEGLGSYESLRSARIGTNIGNSVIKSALEEGIKIEHLYATNQDVLRDLHLGRIDAAILDMPIADFIMKSRTEYSFEWSKEFEPFSIDYYTFAVRKGDAQLLERINSALESIKSDGTLQALIDKWAISVEIAR